MTPHSPSAADAATSSSSSSNVVGVHYRVGKKIGEGSFGVIYEGKTPKTGLDTPDFLFSFPAD